MQRVIAEKLRAASRAMTTHAGLGAKEDLLVAALAVLVFACEEKEIASASLRAIEYECQFLAQAPQRGHRHPLDFFELRGCRWRLLFAQAEHIAASAWPPVLRTQRQRFPAVALERDSVWEARFAGFLDSPIGGHERERCCGRCGGTTV